MFCIVRQAATLASRKLKILMLRYVDDFFSLDREESIEVVLHAFTILVRACLGHDVLAELMLETGKSFAILGMRGSFSM